jgi:cell division protein FtsB
MATIKQRNDHIRIFWRRVAMTGLFFVVLFGIWAVVGVYHKERESREFRQQAEAQYSDLRKRETALNARIVSLQSDRGQEEALREAYQVGKEGERVITIVDKPTSTAPTETPEQKSWLQKVFWWW